MTRGCLGALEQLMTKPKGDARQGVEKRMEKGMDHGREERGEERVTAEDAQSERTR